MFSDSYFSAIDFLNTKRAMLIRIPNKLQKVHALSQNDKKLTA